MDRVIDVSKIKMYQGSVLIHLKMKETKLIAPKGKAPQPMVEYAEVVSLSKDITDLEVGDIVLDFKSSEVFEWRNEKYAIVPRMFVKVAVSADNFIPGTKVADITTLN